MREPTGRKGANAGRQRGPDRDDFRGGHERRPDHGGDRPAENVVFGVEPLRELLAAAPGIVRILYLRAGEERRFAEEAERVRQAGGRVVRVGESELSRLAGSTARTQGILALVSEYRYDSFERVLKEKPDPLLLVDGVTDPRNLGALLRSAEGAGVSVVVLARDRTVGVTPAVVKSSAGAWIHMRIARCGNVARALEALKEAGYWIAALAPEGNVSLYELDTSRPLALVVGSEGKGIREIVKKTADFLVGIPMRGRVQSLNVSVAAAVALFEVARRRAATSSSASPVISPAR
jgi:23S rRNA (guanosine2251-2'-O)-methyltransferase